MDIITSYRRVLETPDMIQGTPEDMPPTDFARVVDLLSASHISNCCLRGNEPTAHAEFGRLLQIAAKRRIAVRVETCGLLTSDARKVLEEQPIRVILKLYHPTVYEDGQLEEIAATMTAIQPSSPDRVSLCAVIDDVSYPLDYLDAFAAKLSVKAVAFRIVCSKELDDLRRFTGNLVPMVKILSARGIRCSLGCGLPPCAFSDADFGALAKLGCLPMK